jgi:hypothetical protein
MVFTAILAFFFLFSTPYAACYFNTDLGRMNCIGNQTMQETSVIKQANPFYWKEAIVKGLTRIVEGTKTVVNLTVSEAKSILSDYGVILNTTVVKPIEPPKPVCIPAGEAEWKQWCWVMFNSPDKIDCSGVSAEAKKQILKNLRGC